MKEYLDVKISEPVVLLASEIVYCQKKEWCEGKYRQLKFSLMKPRNYYSYDMNFRYPLIIFLCGGSFAEVDRNIWMPELEYFAKRGWAVMSIDYSTTNLTKWPEQLEDIKSAIRYMKANADQFCIDSERVIIMGESAGGYLSILAGFTNNSKEYDVGENIKYSSKINAVVALYPVVNIDKICKKLFEETHMPIFTHEYPNLEDVLPTSVPPTLLLHGTNDTIVSCVDTEMLYKKMRQKKIDTTLYLINGANHADHYFFQDSVKKIIYDFISNK